MAGGWRTLAEGSEPVPGYRLLEYLGGGSLGDVWRASGPGGTQVALKIVNLRRRGTLHEFRALEQVKNIRDPHLVPVMAYWLLDESGQVIADPASALLGVGGPAAGDPLSLPGGKPRAVTLVMAMGLGSKSLFDRLEECLAEGHSGIPWKELLEYMEDAARGIDFLNQPSQQHESIIHGDIKPHNILIVGNAAQVCDFGLARAVDSIRATNMPLGTVAYAAPELLQSRPLHRNTDQYCLAVSYVELRTGALPFDAETVVGICERHVKGQLDLSALKPCERTVIARAVSVDPDQRWPSCRDMVRALRRACEADESAGRLGAERLGAEIVPGCWLQEHLGQGSLGACWKARFQDGSWLALKVLDLSPAEAVAQVHALRAVRAIRHERLLPLLRLWVATEEGFVYEDRADPAGELAFLEPYATGVARPVKVVLGWELGSGNLRTGLRRTGEPAGAAAGWRDLLHVLDDVAEGLDFLHSSAARLVGPRPVGLAAPGGTVSAGVHGRLKPENVILAGHAARIGDFGLHAALGRPLVSAEERAAPWVAPEARAGKGGPASDQFALAVAYLEVRTGQPAQPVAAGGETSRAPLAPPVDLSGLPGSQERAVVARALAVRPEDRWPSCQQFVHHLRAACEADERRLQRPRRGAEAPGSEILPGYRLVEKLGQGQIGRVWKAVGRGGMLRALKIVDLRGRAGLKELQALEQVKGIRSGNLISVSSYWLIDHEGFILGDMPDAVASVPAGARQAQARESASFPASELIIEMDLASKTLLQRLRECQRAGLPAIPVDELLRYMEQAAAGIDYLNQPEQRPETPQIEIVHGDIKPQNIMIVGNTAAVGDFGLARIVQRLGVQQTGMGTPAYAAPELLRGLPHRASDQYCLAMTYLELRTGRLPFQEPDAMAIARRHLEGRLDLEHSGLSPAELAVIRKATAMDPRQRFASCAEMVRALREAIEGAASGRPRGFGQPGPVEGIPAGSTLPLPAGQTVAATLVPPSEVAGEAERRTPEPGGALETQPAEAVALPPLGRPAELELTMPFGPALPRRRRRRRMVAGGVLALGALVVAIGVSQPEVRQWAASLLKPSSGQPEPVSPGQPQPPPSPETAPGAGSQPQPVLPAAGSSKSTLPETKPASTKPKMPDRAAAVAGKLNSLLESYQYEEAARLFAAEGRLLDSVRRDAFRTAWLAHLWRQWGENPDSPEVVPACSGMIACFPQNAAEARALRVRALMRQGDYTEAARLLHEEEADPQAAWPPEARSLREALQQLAAVLSQFDLPLEKLQEAQARLERIDWSSVDSRWRLDTAEKARVEELRQRVANAQVVQWRREVADKLGRARDLLDKGRYAETPSLLEDTRKTLEKLRAMPGQSKADLQRQFRDDWLECELLAAVARLGDPASTADQLSGALAAAEKCLEEHSARLTAEQLRLLGSAAGQLRRVKNAGQLDQALALVRQICERLSGRPELGAPMAGLWHARIALQIAQREPTDADFAKFQEDWALWERVPTQEKQRASAAGELQLIELWRLENLLRAGKSMERPLPDLAGLPKEFEPYAHYLVARIHLDSGKTEDALQSLEQLFGQQPPPPFLVRAEGSRLDRAVQSLVKAVDDARRLRPGKNRLQPYADGQEAQRHLTLLRAAQQFGEARAKSHPGKPLAQPDRVGLQVALALAALGANDRSAAAAATEALVREEKELGQLSPEVRRWVHYAFFISHLPADEAAALPDAHRPAILSSAAELFKQFSKTEPLEREEADALYRTVIAPLMARLHKKWQSGDEVFAAALGEFLWTHLEDEWPRGRAEVLEIAEQAFSAAIELTRDSKDLPLRASRLVQRAQVRMAWQPPKLNEAVADVDAAVELDPNGPEIRGVHAEVHLFNSRTKDLRKARIENLKTAMESADLACKALRHSGEEKPGPQRAPQPLLPRFLLTLSMARLEYANFEREKRQEYLDEAARLAQEAASLLGEKAPQSFTTYMALGNAWEDLAWAAEREPEKSYPEAIRAFRRASRARQLPSAEVHRSLGRCYYRAAAESCLDQLEGRDRAGMLQQAEQELEEAVRLDPNDAEAHYFLGLVYWNQDPSNYAKAAECFEKAKSIAVKRNQPERAYYLLQWAVFPWSDPALRRDAQGLEAVWGTIGPRLEELDKAPVPPGAAIHPQREAIRQRARRYAAQENWDEAIRLCQQALQQVAEPDWAEVYLFLDLAQYRLRQAGKALQDNDVGAARRQADEALAEVEKAQQAAISLAQRANCQNLLAQVYTTRWMAGWDAEDWNRAVAAYAEVVNLQPRRRIAQEAASRIATLHLLRASRDQPATYATLELYANGIRWQQSALAALRITTGETAEQFASLRAALRNALRERFAKPVLEKAREVRNTETDPARKQQVEAWMAEWQQIAGG